MTTSSEASDDNVIEMFSGCNNLYLKFETDFISKKAPKASLTHRDPEKWPRFCKRHFQINLLEKYVFN